MTALVLPETPSSDPVQLREGAQVEPLAAGSIYKVQIGVQVSTLLARDVMVVTPHFKDNAGTMSPATAATTLATNMTTYLKANVAGGSVKVYLEDFNPAAPHQPLAVATFGQAAQFLPAQGPREIALCLSYYSAQNVKRYRGRLYIPYAWIFAHMTSPPSTLPERPSATVMTGAQDFAYVVLKSINSAGWQWCVASGRDKVGRETSQTWVDDEWDVIRSRGLRGSTRSQLAYP